jgi:hypothetical protein
MAAALARLLLAATLLGLPGCTILGQGCPGALLEGMLFADPNGNLLVKEDVNGTIWTVRWPAGYGVRTVNGRIVVTDTFGGIKAGDGDRVEIGGGVDSEDASRWAACGNMDSLRG